jgi:DNA-binding transcriptional ArsR family regulator
MPAPDPDFIVAPTAVPVRIALEPAHNVLHSLQLLVKADHLSGLDEWVMRTAAALTPEQRHRNRLVLNGLYYATVPDRGWSSFPAYIEHLAALEPIVLRDRIFNAYAQIPTGDECEHHSIPDPLSEQTTMDVAGLLKSADTFLEGLQERFPAKKLDLEIEAEAYEYLTDPPAMQSLIVSHFQSMWEEVLSPEWDRVVPMLRASVDAFQQIDLSGSSKFQAVQQVLEQEIEDQYEFMFEEMGQIVFVPSAHVGPYAAKYRAGDTLWVLFGARVPEGVHVDVPDLSRAEILVRLSALADDTRLRILKLISEGGELRSQDIMTRLELSQSAASRHLKQLSATGYLTERRCEGAKCYTLNPKRVKDTLHAISAFLLSK